MANEYLKRTPTSTGNTKVFTISLWIKDTDNGTIMCNADTSADHGFYFAISTNEIYAGTWTTSWQWQVRPSRKVRDSSNWMHVIIAVDTTHPNPEKRVIFYINGSEQTTTEPNGYPSLNYDTLVNKNKLNAIGRWGSYGDGYLASNLSDYFFIDGQALTPDVFGFHKDGDGYISAGSTHSTEFKPGQWVPKKPSVIKNSINKSGGFGVNGFYLPMNDSSNVGADFHCDPNSIITLQDETAAQPKNGAPTTTDAYVSQLRTDPYAANLVLAVPGITGAPGVAYTDFSANIKGSGTNKVVTANGNAGVAVTASYYGSALSFDGTGDYFTVPNTADLRMGSDDFTIEAWLNKNDTDSGAIFGLYENGNDRRSYLLYSDGSNDLTAIVNTSGDSGGNTLLGGSASTNLGTNQWHHCVLEREGSYVRLYLNGVVAGIATDLSGSLYENTDDTPAIGTWFNSGAATGDINGYIQDLRVYKGVAKYKGGFDVAKPYTPVGIGTWRAVSDTCKNNFATLNPLNCYGGTESTATLTNGNLTQTTTDGNRGHRSSTIGITTGKWYAEAQLQSANTQRIGVIADKSPMQETENVGFSRSEFSYLTTGTYGFNNTLTAYGASYTNNDVIGIALNRTDGTITFFKNGISQGIATDILNNGDYDDQYFHFISADSSLTASGTFSWNFGQNPTFSGITTAGTNTDANGKGLFKYAPPSGHLALCEDNLPTPAITDPGEYFKTVLYTGDGSVGRSITGVGFKPDFVWIKKRAGGSARSNQLFDSVRGGGYNLHSDSTGKEDFSTTRLLSFDDDGFSISDDDGTNASNGTYVAWCWQAGVGTTSLNTDGAINSVVSVNQDAGFSIISYTGTGSNTTVGHGLTITPNVVICKNRIDDSTNWSFNGNVAGLVYGTNKMVLQGSGNIVTDTNEVMGAGTSILNLGTSSATNDTNDAMIAYCWHSVDGFSKMGGYVGNGDNDGPFVYCGFKPAWVLIKKTDGSGTENWRILDSSRSPFNQNRHQLLPSSSNAESIETGLDLVSNGFKIRDNDAHMNQDGTTYFFMAFAESPFQTANAK